MIRSESSLKTTPTPQKYHWDVFLNYFAEFFGVRIGDFSWIKVSTLSYLNATEAGHVVWDTLYSVYTRTVRLKSPETIKYILNHRT